MEKLAIKDYAKVIKGISTGMEKTIKPGKIFGRGIGHAIPRARIKMKAQKQRIVPAFNRAMTGVSVLMLGALMGAIGDTIYESVQKNIGRVKEPKYFKKMVEAHPELAKESPEAVAKLWSTLYHHAPNMAQDPVAAGAFIRQSIGRGYLEEWGGPSPDTYKTLTDVQKSLSEQKKPSDVGKVMRKGFSASMLGRMLADQGEEWLTEPKMKEMIFQQQVGM